MIYLFTGSPGSGKTLSAIAFIERIQQEDKERVSREGGAPRMVYAANIEGLDMPGVVNLPHEDVLRWHEVCEQNSLVVVDEAQRYWRATRAGEVPQSVVEMETHRHDGIDIVLMTQHPTFLHANIRKLTNVHVHLVAYTKASALRWEWREAHDDVQETSLRNQGEFAEWPYPTHLYRYYKSATQHTKRAKRSKAQVKARIAAVLSIILLVAIIGAGIWLFTRDKSDFVKGGKPATSQQSDHPDAAWTGGKAVPQTPEQYAAAQRPRVPTQPWSAPIYDGASVTRHPRIWCVAMEDGPCRCLTEQGTRYDLEDGMCRALVASGGTYDPYLPEQRQDSQQVAQAASSPTQAVTQSYAAVPTPQGPVIASSGWPESRAAIHDPYVPPEQGASFRRQ